MDPHIGQHGSLVARIVHDDPDIVEAFVQELRDQSGTQSIDWYYIINTIALVKATGDLKHIRHTARLILPPHRTVHIPAMT